MLNTYANSGGRYESIELLEPRDRATGNTATATGPCYNRHDNSGCWNLIRSWSLFFAHTALAVLITIALSLINGRPFAVGSGDTIFHLDSGTRLYQAQVTGLLSLALVILRLVGGACSLLLAWRIIYILLDKRGITLVELLRMIELRMPLLPAFWHNRSNTENSEKGNQGRWAMWASITLLLLWPQAIAAPLASSSISWIPGISQIDRIEDVRVQAVSEESDWASLMYQDARLTSLVSGTSMALIDPSYAYAVNDGNNLPLRRYFNATQRIPPKSRISIAMPYFAVDLTWVDPSSEQWAVDAIRYHQFNSTEVAELNNWVRRTGTVELIREEKWNSQTALPQTAEILSRESIITIKLGTFKEGELPGCPTSLDSFAKLPSSEQFNKTVGWNNTSYYDCYIMAKASIRAGLYEAQQCQVTPRAESDTASLYFATCSVGRIGLEDDDRLQADWLAGLALDFTTETLKFTILQFETLPRITNDFEAYVRGTLTLGYQAAWSGLMNRLGVLDKVNAAFQPVEPVVFISVNHMRMYTWLGLTLGLSVAGISVLLVQSMVRIKTVQNATLAAISIGFSEVGHSTRAQGLCNATGLHGEDKNLPRLRWDKRADSSCVKNVVFDE